MSTHPLWLALNRKIGNVNYFITLSALNSTFGGIVRPICLAVFRLILSSNFVGASTGRSAGFAPFRILSTYVAARRCIVLRSVPYDMRPPLSVQVDCEETDGK